MSLRIIGGATPFLSPLPSAQPLPSPKRYMLRSLSERPVEELLETVQSLLREGFSLGQQFDALARETLHLQAELHAWQRGYHAHKHERRVVYRGEA